MNDFFFGKDALQNYFSELIGIIVTVILIPVIIRINNRKLNFTKRYLAKKILFKLTSDYLETITPKELRSDRVYSYNKRIESYITSFDLKPNFRNVGEFLIMDKLKKKDKKDLKKEISKLSKYFASIDSELSEFYSNYGNVLNRNINRKYFQINFNIKTFSPINFDDDFDLYCFTETWLVQINLIYDLRNLLLKGLRKEELKENSLLYNLENE